MDELNIFKGNTSKRNNTLKRIERIRRQSVRNTNNIKFWHALPRRGSFFNLTDENRERIRLERMANERREADERREANKRTTSLKRSTTTRNLKSFINSMNNNHKHNNNENAELIAGLVQRLNNKKAKTNNKAIQGLLRLLNAANK